MAVPRCPDGNGVSVFFPKLARPPADWECGRECPDVQAPYHWIHERKSNDRAPCKRLGQADRLRTVPKLDTFPAKAAEARRNCGTRAFGGPMRPTPDFDAKAASKKLLREGRGGALATLFPSTGDPYCSLVNVATAADGAPLLLISTLAVHTKNLIADPRCSLMIDERKAGDPLEGGRIMLMGTAEKTVDPEARRRYLERQPEAEMFAGFADFAFYRMKLTRAHLVAGFGRIVDLKPDEVLTQVDDAPEMVAAESDI